MELSGITDTRPCITPRVQPEHVNEILASEWTPDELSLCVRVRELEREVEELRRVLNNQAMKLRILGKEGFV